MNRDKLDKGFIKLQTYNDIWVTEGQVPRHLVPRHLNTLDQTAS